MKTNKVTYWKGFIEVNGIMRFINLIIKKIYCDFFLKNKFGKCDSVLFMGKYRISGWKSIYIKTLTVGENFRMEAIKKFYNSSYEPKIEIGKNVSFGTDIHIGVIDKVVIGDNCLVGSRVTIIDHNHGNYTSNKTEFISHLDSIPSERQLVSAPILIGKNVHIGENSIILKGVKIGDGAVIAAGAVVTTDVEKGCIVAGNPARVRKRYDMVEKVWLRIK